MNKRIEMVFWSDTEGNLHPIKFRVDTEDDKVTCKVLMCVFIEENRFSGHRVLNYRATIDNNGTKQEVKLVYEVDEHRWNVRF